VLGAAALAALVEGGLAAVMLLASSAKGFVPRPEPAPREMSIAVKPILDLPLLKKGGKPRPNKLPEMWKPAAPVKRVEPRAVPTPLAPKEPLPPPDKDKEKEKPEPPKPEEKPTPPEAPVPRRVDDMVKQMQREADEDEPNVPEKGAADGVENGTETDPLKARAVDLYRVKLINWFKQEFSPPVDEIDCATLKGLRASVTAQIASDGTVASYTMVPSGNAIFDARVRRAMDARVGQSIPPPPPNYPDLLEPVVHPTFQGKNEKCK
jgi:hypothetical protein